MKTPVEISIDLNAEDLLALPAGDAPIEVEDVCALDPVPSEKENVAQPAEPPGSAPEALEVELTAEQIEALLAGFEEPPR